MIRRSPRVGLWRSWERASMAWKWSSVRSRPGPPILCDAYRLHPTKRENKQVLHWLRNRSACSTDTASARTDYFNPWSRTLGLGISRTVRNVSRSATPRAAAKQLEISSFDSGIDRRLEQETLSASRRAGKVVGSIPTRSTNFFLMPCIYILQSEKTKKFYIGCASEVLVRLTEHQRGQTTSTRGRGPWGLVYQEQFDTLAEARRRERQLKSWKSHRSIQELIEDWNTKK